jgi:DNA-binding winged helix-turn-helix (wHTH) protein
MVLVSSMTCFEFAGHILDLQQGRLRHGHVDVPLRHKSLSLLIFLVQNRGRVIGKDELLSAVWPGVIVSDDSLTQCITDIRRTLGADARSLIRTVARRGYILDESQVRVLESGAVETMRRLAPPPGHIASPVRDTVLRLVKTEPEAPRVAALAQVIEMSPRSTHPSGAPSLVREFRWKEEDEGWWRHLAPYSTFAGVSILAVCAIVLAPFADVELTFSRGVALLILLAAFRALRTGVPSVGTVLAIQFAATAFICLGLSIADGPMHLFADGDFAGTLVMISIVSACLGTLAARLPHNTGPRWLLLLGGANLVVAVGVASTSWLAHDPFADRGSTIALLCLGLLQIPWIAFGFTLWPARRYGSHSEPARVSVAFITPGYGFVMDAHPGRFIP